MSSLNPRKYSFLVAAIYLGIASFSGIYTVIYYQFSHEIKDIHLTLLFLPGVLSALLFLFLGIGKAALKEMSELLFHFGFASVWAYLLLQGIYTIAKTESSWLFVFLILASVLLGLSLLLTLISKAKEKQQQDNG